MARAVLARRLRSSWLVEGASLHSKAVLLRNSWQRKDIYGLTSCLQSETMHAWQMMCSQVSVMNARQFRRGFRSLQKKRRNCRPD